MPNQGLLRPGLEGGAWSQEPTAWGQAGRQLSTRPGVQLPGPQGHLGPCIPTTHQVQAGRPCRRRQRARRVVCDVTSVLQPHRRSRPAGRHGCAHLVDENKTAGSNHPHTSPAGRRGQNSGSPSCMRSADCTRGPAHSMGKGRSFQQAVPGQDPAGHGFSAMTSTAPATRGKNR